MRRCRPVLSGSVSARLHRYSTAARENSDFQFSALRGSSWCVSGSPGHRFRGRRDAGSLCRHGWVPGFCRLGFGCVLGIGGLLAGVVGPCQVVSSRAHRRGVAAFGRGGWQGPSHCGHSCCSDPCRSRHCESTSVRDDTSHRGYACCLDPCRGRCGSDHRGTQRLRDRCSGHRRSACGRAIDVDCAGGCSSRTARRIPPCTGHGSVRGTWDGRGDGHR